ncbi:MAG: DUF3592 domain-containing protein [Chloroflexi bacterium]|nr:DUF3592 domain-containing protein [Chloroflexota bacterium]
MGNLSTLGPLLIGLTLVVMAVRLGTKAGQRIREWRAIHAWPTVSGTITHSRVRYSAPYDDPDFSHAYLPVIRYSYTVDGVTYADTAFADEDLWPEADAVRLVEQYPLNSVVTVRYDPHAPRRSVLVLPSPADVVQPVALAALVLAVGTVLMLVSVLRLV